MAACPLCGRTSPVMVKPGNAPGAMSVEAVAVTDRRYGQTQSIHRCSGCGLLYCAAGDDPLPYYEALEDRDYEAGRRERAHQMRKILKLVRRYHSGGRLLDVGAATGILVEEAARLGFDAEGVEPSAEFQRIAADRGLKVHRGAFPHESARGPYAVITMVDVIEHVPDPVGLLRAATDVLGEDGVVVVVTPDVNSLAARLMGRRWWHYRVAHIVYFTRDTLLAALAKAGLQAVELRRPNWYFSLGYLLKRLAAYLPGMPRLRAPALLAGVVVLLNLRDSFMVVCRKDGVS